MTTPTTDNTHSHLWTTMDFDLLRRVRKTSAIVGAVMAIPFATYWGLGAGGGWIVGIAWSLLNLHFVASVVKGIFHAGKRNMWQLVLALLVKFPVLYAVGYLILRNDQLPAMWVVAGFTWPFFVIVMKALGRTFLQMDQRNAVGGSRP